MQSDRSRDRVRTSLHIDGATFDSMARLRAVLGATKSAVIRMALHDLEERVEEAKADPERFVAELQRINGFRMESGRPARG